MPKNNNDRDKSKNKDSGVDPPPPSAPKPNGPANNAQNRESFKKVLQNNLIVELKEPAQRFTGEFLFYCLLCEMHLRNERQIMDHIRFPEHRFNNIRWENRLTLDSLITSPSQSHIDALDSLCCGYFCNAVLLNDKNCDDARAIAIAVQRSLENAFVPEMGVDVRIYGSFLTKVHTPRADTFDLDLIVKFSDTKGLELSQLYMRTLEGLQQNITAHLPGPLLGCSFSRVQEVTGSFCPAMLRVTLHSQRNCFRVNLALGPIAEKAYLSTKLVFAYLQIWPRLKEFMIFIRHWAQINKFTSPSMGISSYVFDLLCIHYLQQTKYLPVLNELLDEFSPKMSVDDFDIDKLCNLPVGELICISKRLRAFYYGSDEQLPSLSIGQMVFGFFKYFATQFDPHYFCKITCSATVEKPYTAQRYFSVTDPFLDTNAVHFQLDLHNSFWNCLTRTASYLCIPQSREFGPKFLLNFEKRYAELRKMKVYYFEIKVMSKKWRTRELASDGGPLCEYQLEGLLRNDEQAQVGCQYCNQTNHCELVCEFAAPFPFLFPPMHSLLDKELSRTILRHFDATHLSDDHLRNIYAYLGKLEELLGEKLGLTDLRLVPFGSMVNGFGSQDGDLDLCLRSDQLMKDLEERAIVNIARVLRERGCIVESVLSAKVPIVKFTDQKEGFKGDISIGNCLGLKNSEMLKTYTGLDGRIAPLGLFIKHWARKVGLNDSPNGSFSSYSLIILLIAFLQRGCQPPVLPYLQELASEKEREELDGWDVTFECAPVNHFSQQNGADGKSLATLLVEFFTYYLTKFNPLRDVVQIRRSIPLLKMDKSEGRRWSQYAFCVEDPFELSHNLTGGVKMEVVVKFNRAIRQTLSQLALLDRKLTNADNSSCKTGVGTILRDNFKNEQLGIISQLF